MINPLLCLNDSRSTARDFTVPWQYSQLYPYIVEFLRSSDLVNRDDQIAGAASKAPHYADQARAICSGPLEHLFVSFWITPLDLHDTTTQNSVLNVNDVKVVLRHLFHGVGGHVVLPKPDPVPDSFDPRSPHPPRFPATLG